MFSFQLEILLNENHWIVVRSLSVNFMCLLLVYRFIFLTEHLARGRITIICIKVIVAISKNKFSFFCVKNQIWSIKFIFFFLESFSTVIPLLPWTNIGIDNKAIKINSLFKYFLFATGSTVFFFILPIT